MTERTTGNARELHFSIQGELITNLAREKLFFHHDFAGAVETILACTVTDQISEAERVATALAILDGRQELRGVYPGPEYGVYEVEPSARDEGRTLVTYFADVREKFKEMDAKIQTLQDKLSTVVETWCPSETEKRACDDAYRACHDRAETIFGTEPERDMSPLLASFLHQQHEGPDDPYGWLFPDGTFHPVEWGEHQSWALEYLEENDPEFDDRQDDPETRIPLHAAGDYLNKRHRAVLLHNPARGVAAVTNPAGHALTKRQREFLFDYYSKLGMAGLANSFVED